MTLLMCIFVCVCVYLNGILSVCHLSNKVLTNERAAAAAQQGVETCVCVVCDDSAIAMYANGIGMG